MASSWVQGGTASITVGPDNCDIAVGPISFSAFNLPSGVRYPYSEQELIAHHPDNGAKYTFGSYTLNLDFAVPCNWQTDLYLGTSESDPSFGDRLLDSDWVENQVCVEETTPTTVAVETAAPTTTATTATTGAEIAAPVATATGDTTTTAVASAGPTNQVAGDSGVTARANPAGSPALPATGPTETLMIGLLGGALLGLGTLARRVART